MQKIICLLLPAVLVFYSCDPVVDVGAPQEVQGYVPVYSNDKNIKKITAEAPRTTIKGGKIYTTGKFLFQVEPDSGIHVINYADPQHPQKIGFIHSLLCKELSVKDGFVYTNNFSDLVVVDIRDISHVQEISRIENVFPELSLQFPPKDSSAATTYFECADPSKGVVVKWELKTIKNPKCRRQ